MGRCIVKTGFRFENPFLSRASISVTVLANAFKLFQFQHFISQMVEFTISFIFHTSLFPTISMTFFVLFFCKEHNFFSRVLNESQGNVKKVSEGRSSSLLLLFRMFCKSFAVCYGTRRKDVCPAVEGIRQFANVENLSFIKITEWNGNKLISFERIWKYVGIVGILFTIFNFDKKDFCKISK